MSSLNTKTPSSLNIIQVIQEAHDLIGRLSAASSAREMRDDLLRCVDLIRDLEERADNRRLTDQDYIVDMMRRELIAKITMAQCASLHGGEAERAWREFENGSTLAKYDRNTAHRLYMKEYMRRKRKGSDG